MCGCKMPVGGPHNNILDLCRLCLCKDSDLIPVLDSSPTGNQLSDKICVCLAVEIKNEDEVSQKICHHCLTKVNSFFEFRSSTLECQKVLQRWASEANQYNDVALNNKDKEALTNEPNTTIGLNTPSETPASEADSSRDCGSRYNEETVTQELIKFYKSLASNDDSSTSDVISPESEVPGPSGLQEGNKNWPFKTFIELERLTGDEDFYARRKRRSKSKIIADEKKRKQEKQAKVINKREKRPGKKTVDKELEEKPGIMDNEIIMKPGIVDNDIIIKPEIEDYEWEDVSESCDHKDITISETIDCKNIIKSETVDGYIVIDSD